MDQKRPRGREKHVTNNSTGVHKRGEGLGTGPVGSSGGYAGRKGSSGGSGGGKRAAGGGSLGLIVIAVLYLLFGRGGNNSSDTSAQNESQQSSSYSSSSSSSAVSNVTTSTSSIDTSVASGSRSKYTSVAGNGNDTVTLMVYMCGTDLESKNGMATSDLSEMAAARFGEKVNLLVYTGGCNRWQTSGISSSTNQIYQVADGKIKRLADNLGSKVMTDPATLSYFIKWCASKFPANRYDLILWDHGGGSVSGYGYDEKYARKGSMSLAGINTALKDGGVKFDFIGFDACLMATAETALMLNSHADYMIASEETEPGIGWFYTNWLNSLGSDTSQPTVETGKNIIDDFVAQCARRCSGQKTTLSIIDLAEFANTVPKPLASFSKSISSLISNKEYQTVSDARYNTREFASSSRIDQIDLVDLCLKMGNSEGKALSKALKGAVKYNKTSSNMTNAYGVSIYFPYQKASYVDKACETYEAIGMDDEYAKCIREFASLEVSGQVAAGGSSSSAGSLLGTLLGSAMGSSSGSSGNAEVIGQLLGTFLGGSGGSLIEGLTGLNTSFLSGRAMSVDETADYLSMNYFNAGNLVWTKNGSKKVIHLSEDQWKKVHSLDLNMFYDDGEGFIDLGLDNVYDFTDDGDLIAASDRTWIAINGQPVAYYHVDTVENGDDYTITGRVPAFLNGDRVNLWLVFDNANPYGYIAGAQYDYKDSASETEPSVVAKNMTELEEGDKLEFICDYYSYDGDYQDSYYLGEPMIVSDSMEISNVDVGDGDAVITYRFTDLYNQAYWSESITLKK
ncbi:MAG: hypothetical protein K6G00_11530 [Treponema sp.]|nr:hypothetical protein [Treponema sp.]